MITAPQLLIAFHAVEGPADMDNYINRVRESGRTGMHRTSIAHLSDLHFGAVDFESTVWVNGKELGTHTGGYDAFSYDITDALKNGGAGPQEVIVGVREHRDRHSRADGLHDALRLRKRVALGEQLHHAHVCSLGVPGHAQFLEAPDDGRVGHDVVAAYEKILAVHAVGARAFHARELRAGLERHARRVAAQHEHHLAARAGDRRHLISVRIRAYTPYRPFTYSTSAPVRIR